MGEKLNRFLCGSDSKIGDAAEEIVALATELHNDQIVMGTHGRGALQGLLMGSTTTKVIHLAKVPVLLVK